PRRSAPTSTSERALPSQASRQEFHRNPFYPTNRRYKGKNSITKHRPRTKPGPPVPLPTKPGPLVPLRDSWRKFVRVSIDVPLGRSRQSFAGGRAFLGGLHIIARV